MADIGDKLRSARKAKGMSIEDVEKITKIQRRYLAAIENNEFDQLPGDFYVRAFIRQYADIVGLDGKELLEDFQSEVPEAKPEEYVENSIDNKSEEIKRTTNNKKGLWKSYLPKAATVIGILLVIFVVYLVYGHFFSGSNQQSANESDNVTVSSHVTSSKPKKAKTKKSSAKAQAVKVKKLANNSFNVTGLTNNRTLKVSTGAASVWVQVSVDGQSLWQGTLQANKSHEIKLAKNVKSVSIQLGNTQTTNITIAGKQLPVAKSTSTATVQLTLGNTKSVATSSSSANSQSSSATSQVQSSVAQSSNTQTVQSSQTNNTQTGSQNNGGQNNQ
ncbi:cytoskeletal protein RodZ [Lactobacillus colini]|uniref:Cytoskeletal protein RodZ n=1 Tax=Lactobacillus colini TaxID=1819254 RepID=A0ABS4ME70_9LACO|nr:RodZ domain-containing protein [Lactobacillus colini]MBP2057646.1 cytoskeletal protein RodZ [Lactobacillus colini]